MKKSTASKKKAPSKPKRERVEHLTAEGEASGTKPGKAEPEAEDSKKPKNAAKFQIGENVVYPLQGVGKIEEKIKREFKGKLITYYKIYIEATDMTLLLPVDKLDSLGLRPIISKNDAKKALHSMADKDEPLTSDWRMRYQNNLTLLKTGGILDIAFVVRSLYHRSKVKELPILERRLYDNALKLMIDEISLALDRPKDEVENLLHSRLES